MLFLFIQVDKFIIQSGDGINYNFSRDTKDYGIIHLCDDQFNVVESIDNLQYGLWLKDKYNCNIDELSFREIVGRYTRVYGKENLNERTPIKYFERETDISSVNSLIKLFDKYKVLEACESRILDLQERKKIFSGASKKNSISIPANLTQFRNNEAEINELEVKVDSLKSEIKIHTLDYKALLSDDLLELQKMKSDLLIQKSRLQTRLSRTKSTIKNKRSRVLDEKEQFITLFPEVNMEKLEKIDNFHSNLIHALKKELNEASKEINNEIMVIENELFQTDNDINKLLNLETQPSPTIDLLVEYTQRINKLKESNLRYLNEKENNDELKNERKNCKDLKTGITDSICSVINEDMAKSIRFIYSDERRIPTFNIHGNRYTFKTAGDTGTGTNYSSLISFDLSLLKFTCLPFLVHDLPLLKNIENDAFGNIIKLYNKFEKQTFIAIDKLNSYNKDTNNLIQKQKVIQLTKDDILFTKNWKIKKSL